MPFIWKSVDELCFSYRLQTTTLSQDDDVSFRSDNTYSTWRRVLQTSRFHRRLASRNCECLLHTAARKHSARPSRCIERKTSRMMRLDLAAARAKWLEEAKNDTELQDVRQKSDFPTYCDGSGLYADFHSNRHTFITSISRSQVSPKVAQTRARHSDIRLTMAIYTHVGKTISWKQSRRCQDDRPEKKCQEWCQTARRPDDAESIRLHRRGRGAVSRKRKPHWPQVLTEFRLPPFFAAIHMRLQRNLVLRRGSESAGT